MGNLTSLSGDRTDSSSADEERWRALAEHHAQRARTLDKLLSSITDFAYIFDLQGRFTFVNKALLDLWGLTLEQAVGKNLVELKYPAELADKLQRQIQQVIETRQRVVDETAYTSPGGVEGFYQYILSPVIGPEGQVEAVAGSTRDITQEKHLLNERERLLRAEQIARAEAESANRAKDKFLAVLSHELRTPLSPVVMSVPAIENDPELPAKFRDDLAMIRRNIELEVKLIDDLLDLSRVTTGKLRLQMQAVEVHEVLRYAMQNCMTDIAGKNLRVTHELKAGRDCVKADPARLQQVFWNLLRNAMKFTPEGGEIFIRTWNSRDNKHVNVEIRDTGIGIDADALPRIFDAFQQGNSGVTGQFGGLGLGLAIAKAVVEMHGGTITADSAGRNRGAAFTVRLNTAPRHLPSTDAKVPPKRPTQHAPALSRVLLVEDHRDTARVLARMLRQSGFEVKTADSAAAALAVAAREEFDVIVSDIGLPDATGYELMEKIRDRYGIKGVALSGYGMEEDMRKSRAAGFVDHVVKPVDLAQLESVLRRVAGD